MSDESTKSERTLLVTRLTVWLVLGTILSCMAVVIAAGVFAIRSIHAAERAQSAAERAAAAAQVQLDRTVAERDELASNEQCRAAVEGASDLAVLANIEAIGGLIEAQASGLSIDTALIRLREARTAIVEANRQAEQQLEECAR